MSSELKLKHASLFSGIGGFDLAAECAGWTNVFNCEIDGFCRRVLSYHFPKVKQYYDIRTTDFTEWRDYIDVLTGGFPCQPFSVAGKRLGTDDNRHLWPEMLRAIREISPRWVVGENVYGFVNWSQGLVLETVCADLESQGYEVQPFVIPACAVGAPHRRDRIWIVAHRSDSGAEGAWAERFGAATSKLAANADGERFSKFNATQKSSSEALYSRKARSRDFAARQDWDGFPIEPAVRRRDDGLSDRLDAITFPSWCRESIKAFGNAIVPQVGLRIFEVINEIEGART